MVRVSEESLRKLQLVFLKNGHEKLTEFEVTRPAYFRVVVEPNHIPKSRNFILLPSITAPKGSTLDIRFDVDADSEEISIATQHAKRFLRLLADSLPSKPWVGLGALESRREENKWKSSLLADSD
jgi:hypothetical protein